MISKVSGGYAGIGRISEIELAKASIGRRIGRLFQKIFFTPRHSVCVLVWCPCSNSTAWACYNSSRMVAKTNLLLPPFDS